MAEKITPMVKTYQTITKHTTSDTSDGTFFHEDTVLQGTGDSAKKVKDLVPPGMFKTDNGAISYTDAGMEAKIAKAKNNQEFMEEAIQKIPEIIEKLNSLL